MSGETSIAAFTSDNIFDGNRLNPDIACEPNLEFILYLFEWKEPSGFAKKKPYDFFFEGVISCTVKIDIELVFFIYVLGYFVFK